MSEQQQESADLSAAEAQLTGEVPTPVQADGSGEAAPASPTPEGAKAEVGAPPITPTKTFKVDGRDVTLDELISSGNLEKLITTGQMAGHHQRIAEERAKELEAIKARNTELEKPPAQPQGPSHEQKRAMVTPIVQEIATKGTWGPQWSELAKEWPEVVSDFVIDRLEREALVKQVGQRLAAIEESFGQIHKTAGDYQAEAMREGFRAKFGGWLDAMAGQNSGAYADLKTPDHRAAFTKYVAAVLGERDLNDPAITDKLVGQLYWAFLAETAPDALAQLRAQAATAAAKQRTAAAEPGGRRSAPRAETDLERAERDLMA